MRVWDHHAARWRLTRKGKRWARAEVSEFVISIPVEMFIRRKDGREASFYGYLPIQNTRIGHALSLSQSFPEGDHDRILLIEGIKRRVKKDMENTERRMGTLFFSTKVTLLLFMTKVPG